MNTLMNIGYMKRSTEILKNDDAPLNKLSVMQNYCKEKLRYSLEFLNPLAIKYINEKYTLDRIPSKIEADIM